MAGTNGEKDACNFDTDGRSHHSFAKARPENDYDPPRLHPEIQGVNPEPVPTVVLQPVPRTSPAESLIGLSIGFS